MVRSVEVVVGYTDGSWDALWIEIDEPINLALDDNEMSERAEERAEAVMAKAGRGIVFTKVLYIEDPKDEEYDI